MKVILRFQTIDEYTTWVLENPDTEHMAFVAETTRVYYGIDVPPEPFFIEALQDGTPVTMSIGSPALKNAMEYSLDGINWLPMPSVPTFTLENAGDRIYFKSSQAPQGQLTFTSNASSKPYKVGGALNSLCNDTDVMPANAFESLFEDNKALVDASALTMPERTSDYCYTSMFAGCESLQTIPSLPAEVLTPHCYEAMFMDCPMLKSVDPELLPATVLADYCYQDMFKNSGLKETPYLPAQVSAPHCYDSMFENCDNLVVAHPIQAYTSASYACQEMFKDCDALTTAPDLPATILATYCYKNMFQNCSALTQAPALPAMELSSHCYEEMFNNCDALVVAPALPAKSLAVSCYEAMFKDCDALVNAPNLPATELDVNCYKDMFNHCDSLKNTPDLPAPYLETGCYDGLFQDCPNVSEVHISAREWDALYSSKDWLRGASPTGTITGITEDLNIPTDSYSGVPTNWNYTAPKPITFTATSLATVTYTPNTPNSAWYSLDDGTTWLPYTSGSAVHLMPGESVQFKDDAPANGAERFVFTGGLEISGDIASINGSNYSTVNPYAFSHLFENCVNSNFDASKLNLNYDPLSNNCYEYMFWNDRGLTNAPALPALTLAPYCYAHMFEGCNLLEKAPDLPATTLEPYCYKEMFKNCVNLHEVSTSANPWNSTYTYEWLAGTPNEGTFYNNGNADNIPCPSDSGCPYGWQLIGEPAEGVAFESTTGAFSITITPPTYRSTTTKLYYFGLYYRTSPSAEWTKLDTWDDTYTLTGSSYYEFKQTGDTLTCRFNNINGTNIIMHGHLSAMLGYEPVLHGSQFYNSFNDNPGIIDISRLIPVDTDTAPAECYTAMFSHCPNLTKIPEGFLPATNLGDSCYHATFYGCTKLTSVPKDLLPATTLAEGCYGSMFAGCTSLATPPDLPATVLADHCYQGMFYDCTSLTEAPALPATTLVNRCYFDMFNGCTSLTQAPTLHSTNIATGCYLEMFENCTSLTSVPTLPSTTIFRECYMNMFKGCTSLTTIPDNYLPVTTLDIYCYAGMFNGCSKLTNAPKLPSTQLAGWCYEAMFENCSSLTTPPALPATTLAEGCYREMFANCAKLTTAPTLPATTLANYCYMGMFTGCSSLTTAPALPATTLNMACYYEMFTDCIKLTTAPTLPATTLVNSCYFSMFMGCTKLTSVTTYATSWDMWCARYWLQGTATSGTFHNLGKATNIPRSENGCPTSWSLVNS